MMHRTLPKLALLTAVLLSACQSAAIPTVTPNPTATATLAATATPRPPTITPTPTDIPPTATSTPGPELDLMAGNLKLRKAEIVDVWPPSCSSAPSTCLQTAYCCQILALWVEPVDPNQAEAITQALFEKVDDISVTGDTGTESPVAGVYQGEGEVVILFTPLKADHSFVLNWHELKPIPFDVGFQSDELAAASTGGTRLFRLIGQSDQVWDLEWSPDNALLASADADGTLFVWDTATGNLVKPFEPPFDGPTALAWAPDGSALAVATSGGIIFYDTENWKVFNSLLTTENVQNLVWSVDGSTIVSAQAQGVVVWDIQSGKPQKTFEAADGALGLAVSPDGSMIAGSVYDLYVWDVKSGDVVFTEDLGQLTFSLDWSPDGKTLAVPMYEGTARLFDTSNWEKRDVAGADTSRAYSLGWSPTASRLALGHLSGQVTLWDVALDEPLGELAGHSNGVQRVVWSNDGTRLAVGDGNGNVYIWRID